MDLAMIPDLMISNEKKFAVIFFDREHTVKIIGYIEYEEMSPGEMENLYSYWHTGKIDYLPAEHYIKLMPDTDSTTVIKNLLKPLVLVFGREENNEA